MANYRIPLVITRFLAAIMALSLLIVPVSGQTNRSAQPGPVVQSLQSDAILAHLGRTVAWYRRLQTLQPDSDLNDDVVSRDRLRETSTSALQLSFDFARAAVPLANTSANAGQAKPPGESADANSNLDRAMARSTDRIAALQARLQDIDAQRAKASGTARDTLNAQRDEVEAALALAKDVQTTIQNLAQFAARGGSNAGAGGGLAAQIAQLERSVPEARRATTKGSTSVSASTSASASPPASNATTPANGVTEQSVVASPFRPESAGLIALVTQLFTLRAHYSDLGDVLRQTDALQKGLDDIRTPLVNTARDLMRQADSLTSPTAVHDAAEAATSKQALQSAASQFKQLSTVILPLAEQNIATDASRATIAEWRERITGQIGTTARYLLFRALTLAVLVIVVLALSEVWRRATFRYLHDTRRRRQFLLLRRIVVSVAITIVLVLGIVSEAGSLATYAGFVTAGIAVAMQNVILAIVAYFFLIGRYGVRVGDRITLSGVTGNVIEIGLVRLYLMELSGRDFHPTGRIVVLSNAVLFQPSALFKQVPGADYLWHVITLTFAATVDAQELETRLRAAADSVYEDYRPSIEEQYAKLQHYVNIETRAPHPDVIARLTSAGLECTVRYPTELGDTVATDRKMLDALRAALAKDPPLTLVSSSGPSAE